MGTNISFFIIKPQPKLEKLLEVYKQDEFQKICIWEFPESSDAMGDREAFYTPYVKVAFLADIIAKFDLPAVKKLHPNYENIVYEIFGKPPKFNINTLDEGWTFERAEIGKEFSYVISSASAETLQQIEKTGLDHIDKWLEKIST